MRMKKGILFLSMFAWLWTGMGCSSDEEVLTPIEEPSEPVKYLNMNEKDSLALAISLRSFLLESID